MYNRVIIMGRLTRDPELKQTTSGVSVCRISVAVDRGFVKEGEERKADFFDVTLWRNQAEFVSRYFGKGRMIHIEGKLQNDNYEDQNGVKHYRTVIQADSVSFCGDKQQNANAAPQNAHSGGYNNSPQNYTPNQGTSYNASQPHQNARPQNNGNGYYQQQPMQPQYQQAGNPLDEYEALADDALPW